MPIISSTNQRRNYQLHVESISTGVVGRLYLQEIIDTTQTLLWLRVGKFSTTVQPVLLHHRHPSQALLSALLSFSFVITYCRLDSLSIQKGILSEM